VSRISSGTMVVGIFAVLVGLGGAYLVRQQLQQPPAVAAAPEVRAPRPTVIPMAAIDLEPGREIKMGDVLLVSFTPEQLAKQKLPTDSMVSAPQIIGRYVKDKVKRGMTFTPGVLYPDGTGPSVADRLKPGYRAVTVPITNVGSVARFASPGSVVDVLFRTSEDEEIPETTVLLIDKVEVLAMDTSSYPKALTAGRVTTDTALVTQAVTPKQASALKVAEGRGEFTLAMRSLEDELESTELENGLTLNELLRVAPSRKPQKLDIYLGGKATTVVFGAEKTKGAVLPAVVMPVAADDARPAEPRPPVIPTATVSN
jgi:pilus assembly protein CpaB